MILMISVKKYLMYVYVYVMKLSLHQSKYCQGGCHEESSVIWSLLAQCYEQVDYQGIIPPQEP